MPWSPLSPYLSIANFFFRNYVKDDVFTLLSKSTPDLLTEIGQTTASFTTTFFKDYETLESRLSPIARRNREFLGIY